MFKTTTAEIHESNKYNVMSGKGRWYKHSYSYRLRAADQEKYITVDIFWCNGLKLRLYASSVVRA